MQEKQLGKNTLGTQNESNVSFKYLLEQAKAKGVDLSFDDVREIQKQIQAVKDRCLGTEKWLKAPNGKETKLTEGQWLAVRTPNFKAWFGDWENNPREASKAVDQETEEPKVYFHGSALSIDMFKSLADKTEDVYDNHGIYFSPNSEASSNFAILKSEKIEDGAAMVYPVFLCLRNPKEVTYSRSFSREQKEALLRDGFDGAIEIGGERTGYYQDDIIVVFEASQVKSAVSNIGTFNKDIKDMSL